MQQDDIPDLPLIGGTAAGGYYRAGEGIVIALPHEGFVQSEPQARDSLSEQHRIARDWGRKIVTVVIVDRVRGQSTASRRIWRDEVDPDLVCGIALVSSRRLGRAIASFFIGLTRPRVATVMVGSLDDALAWARQQLQSAGGERV